MATDTIESVERQEVTCPLCKEYSGPVSSVEAHISRKTDSDHQGEVGWNYRNELTGEGSGSEPESVDGESEDEATDRMSEQVVTSRLHGEEVPITDFVQDLESQHNEWISETAEEVKELEEQLEELTEEFEVGWIPEDDDKMRSVREAARINGNHLNTVAKEAFGLREKIEELQERVDSLEQWKSQQFQETKANRDAVNKLITAVFDGEAPCPECNGTMALESGSITKSERIECDDCGFTEGLA